PIRSSVVGRRACRRVRNAEAKRDYEQTLLQHPLLLLQLLQLPELSRSSPVPWGPTSISMDPGIWRPQGRNRARYTGIAEIATQLGDFSDGAPFIGWRSR